MSGLLAKVSGPLCLLLLTGVVCAQSYRPSKHKDTNGYTYETYANDPVGLRVYTLKNGLTVYLAKSNDPQVMCATAIRVGYIHDPDEHTGLAHYEEHTLFNGNARLGSLNWKREAPLLDEIENLYEQHFNEKDSVRKKILFRKIDSLSLEASKYSFKNEFRSVLQKMGAPGSNGVTNVESAIYGSIVPEGALERYLKLEAERYRDPSFRALHTEMEIVFEEFNQFQDNTFMPKYYTANRLLFPTHNYGRPGIGIPQHLKNPSVRTLKKHYQTYYVPNNMAVILIGNLEFDQAIRWVDNAFRYMKPHPVERIHFEPEKEILQPVVTEITDPGPASVFLAYRMKGIMTEDEVYFTLLAKLLENPSFGLLKEELKSTQKVTDATSYSFFKRNDYSVHYLEAVAKEGQSLDEAKDALISLLEKIKRGDFDERLLTACANDLRISFMKSITTQRNLDAECASLFTQFMRWDDRLAFFDKLSTVTKIQLMKFAERVYKNNYVIIYKKKGAPASTVKMKSPGITPIIQNDNAVSDFALSLQKIPVKQSYPETIEYAKRISYKTLRSGVNLAYVENKQSNLFELDIIFDIGRRADRKLALAVNYIPFAQTSRYNAAEIKKEFFLLGLTFQATAQDNRTIFHLEGLADNIERGIELINNIIQDLQPSAQTYDTYLSYIRNTRKSVMSNKTHIRNTLYNYGFYGDSIATRMGYTEAELKAMPPDELAVALRKLSGYNHQIFFYGKDLAVAEQALNKHYITAMSPQRPVQKIQDARPTRPVIYFTDYDGSQAEVYFLIRGEKFRKEDMAMINLLNRFIGQTTFLEVREKRSLAYNSWASFNYASQAAGYNTLDVYAATQVSKLGETMDVMHKLTRDISGFEAGFENAKKEQLKAYEAEHFLGSAIFWHYEDFIKKLEIDQDQTVALYEQTKEITFADFIQFFSRNFGGKEASVVIVGSKKDIDFTKLSAFGTVQEMTPQELFNYR